MQHRRLGRSAIYVSDICMGTMTFGSQTDEAESLRILDASFDAGINFYDTAENYPVPPDTKWAGRTEEIVGKWLKTKDRDSIILATKVCGPSHGWIKGIVGCSNEDAWGLMKSLEASSRLGTVRYETIQNNFSLNNRRFEDALSKVCRKEDVSLIPYSPIGGGVLSGKYQDGARPEGARFSRYLEIGGRQAAMAQRFVNEKSLASTARFMDIAKEAGINVVTLATAWSKQHDFVASTIVGVSKFDQLDDIFAAADLTLADDVMKACNAVTKEIQYPMG